MFPFHPQAAAGFLLTVALVCDFAGEITSRLGVICRHSWAGGMDEGSS